MSLKILRMNLQSASQLGHVDMLVSSLHMLPDESTTKLMTLRMNLPTVATALEALV